MRATIWMPIAPWATCTPRTGCSRWTCCAAWAVAACPSCSARKATPPTSSFAPWASAVTHGSTPSICGRTRTSPMCSSSSPTRTASISTSIRGEFREYSLLLTRPDHFSPEDIAHVMGYMAYSFAEAFRTDALIDHVRGTLGERHAQELLPGLPDTSPSRSARILPGQTDTPLAPLLDQLAQVQSYLPVGQFHGSNAWAVSGQLSASGKPLLANDPHIGFAVPAVWYEAHIRTPEHEVYGHFLAGLPFPLLGHTPHHAWGLTMLMNDEIDFYREQVNPDNPMQVRVGNRWQDLEVHEEVIKVRNKEDRLIRLRSSRHGPIINDDLVLAS